MHHKHQHRPKKTKLKKCKKYIKFGFFLLVIIIQAILRI